MTNQHPLTDEMCSQIQLRIFSPVAEEECMRAAADWQLEQVIEWLRSVPPRQYLILWDCDNQMDKDELIADLKKSMRPQESSD